MNPYLARLHAKTEVSLVQEVPKLSKGAFGSFDSTRTNENQKIEAANDPGLADLLHRYGGFDAVDWGGLALTTATASSLWVVQRPDGLLTVLATVEPIERPQSYRMAWPARWTTPELLDEVPEPAAAAAAQVVQKARQTCTSCTHRSLATSRRLICGKGHPVHWQLKSASGSAYLRRADRRDCGDGEA